MKKLKKKTRNSHEQVNIFFLYHKHFLGGSNTWNFSRIKIKVGKYTIIMKYV